MENLGFAHPYLKAEPHLITFEYVYLIGQLEVIKYDNLIGYSTEGVVFWHKH